MNTLKVTDEQLWVIQNALDMYSRIGIGQFDKIKDHPTFEKHVENLCRPDKEPEVGDRTPQGEILEIKDDMALINGSVKDGRWCKDQEWKPLDQVVLSTNYTRFHGIREEADRMLTLGRNILYGETSLPPHASWGIHNPDVDNSCRIAFDIIQVIRHERWRLNPGRSHMTVDSSIHFTSTSDSYKIQCTINEKDVV